MTEYHIVPRASSAYRTLRRFCLRKPRAGRTHRAGSGVCRYLRDRAESARCEHIRAGAIPLTPFFFLFRRKRENGASGRNGTDAPKGEKNDHLFRLTTPFCRMMFAYCEVSPLCTM